MLFAFDFDNIADVEFGICKTQADSQIFNQVPVGEDVKEALRQTVRSTFRKMHKNGSRSSLYQPSERHKSSEYLHLPLDNNLAGRFREIYDATTLEVNSSSIGNTKEMSAYFARM